MTDARELEALRRYFGETEAMRKSILAWLAGERSKEGWIFPHGSKELKRALQEREPMTETGGKG